MKHLKLFLTALLVLALLTPLCAVAEEALPFMELMSQDVYLSATLLTTASYPEIHISPYYFSSTFVSGYKDPYFMVFPCPPGSFVSDFDEYSASFLDLEAPRQLIYIGQDGYSYENFLNKCDVEDYILADGSDALAVYIDPTRQSAYALIGVPEIDKSAKLEIRIIDNSLNNRSEQEVIDALTSEINDEVARVKASMTVELADAFWTAGRYAGFNVTTNSRYTPGLGLRYTLPEGYCITKLDGVDVSMAKVLGKNDAIEVDSDLDTYSYVSYKYEEDPDSVVTVSIDGNEYRIWAHWYNDEFIMSAYVDRVISTTAGSSQDQTMYWTLKLELDGSFKFESTDALVAELTTIVSGAQIADDMTIANYRDATPYAATEVAVQEAEPVNDDSWVCPSCGETITTNFCPNDGTAKPAEAA